MTRGNDHARHPGIDVGLARLIDAGRRTLDRFALAGQGRRRPAWVPERLTVLPGPAAAESVHVAIERERAGLARELHDELGALLAGARLELHALVRNLGPIDAAAQARVAALERTLQAGVDLKVRLVEGLRPSTLSLLGLAPALEEMLLAFAGRFEGEVECDLHDDLVLDDGAALALYRCAQESLTNICKHASSARTVRVALRGVGAEAILEVEDDGPGFDQAGTRVHRHGLAGLHERLAAAGGALSVVSRKGIGTRIVARLPLAPNDAARNLPSPEHSDLPSPATHT